MLDKNRPVIVRVWTSKSNKEYPGNDNLGHVSIEADGKYMSFWPSVRVVDAIPEEEKERYRQASQVKKILLLRQKYLQRVNPHDNITQETDFESEGGKPQLTLCFYSLDNAKIITEFNERKKNTDFRLYGSNLLVENISEMIGREKKADCCASFAYKLLLGGGLKVNKTTASRDAHSSYLSPDNLLPALLEAKEEELRKFPDIMKFEQYKKNLDFVGNKYEEIEFIPDLKNANCNNLFIGGAVTLGLFAVATAFVYSNPSRVTDYVELCTSYFKP
jgi:hypothetical protein